MKNDWKDGWDKDYHHYYCFQGYDSEALKDMFENCFFTKEESEKIIRKFIDALLGKSKNLKRS